MFLLIVIANEQIPRILKSSNFGSKIAKKCKIRINCRRKWKLESKDAEFQALSKNK